MTPPVLCVFFSSLPFCFLTVAHFRMTSIQPSTIFLMPFQRFHVPRRSDWLTRLHVTSQRPLRQPLTLLYGGPRGRTSILVSHGWLWIIFLFWVSLFSFFLLSYLKILSSNIS